MFSSNSKTVLVVTVACFTLSACSSAKIFDNTTDAVVFVGSTAVKGVYGASRLVVRGAAAGVKRLQTPSDGYPAGAIVCLNEEGVTYAEAVETDGKFVCPAPS